MKFCKYQGAGNDFVIVDNMDLSIKEAIPELAAAVCDRRFGVGADGFILAEPSDQADVKMNFYNADGSVAGMCGNGIRCFAKFITDHGITSGSPVSVETGDGIKHVEIIESAELITRVRVDMGSFSEMRNVSSCGFDVTAMHLGVPHAVIFADTRGQGMEKLSAMAEEHGHDIEFADEFSPAHTNVNFVEIRGEDSILCSTWERGAGKTLACGTGACSSAVASHLEKGLADRIRVTMPGGEVIVSVKKENDTDIVYMEGSAVLTFKGEYF